MQFVVVGVVVQVVAIVLESIRLTMTQVLLQRKGVKLNPISALYFIAPCCFVGLLPLVYAVEFGRLQANTAQIPAWHLLANSLAAFGATLQTNHSFLWRTDPVVRSVPHFSPCKSPNQVDREGV